MSIEEKIYELKIAIAANNSGHISDEELDKNIERIVLDIQKETARQMVDIDPKSHLTDTLLKNHYKLITGEDYE